MADDSKYQAALVAALVILDTLATRPDMLDHERLACVTFAILDAMNRVNEERPGSRPGHHQSWID